MSETRETTVGALTADDLGSVVEVDGHYRITLGEVWHGASGKTLLGTRWSDDPASNDAIRVPFATPCTIITDMPSDHGLCDLCGKPVTGPFRYHDICPTVSVPAAGEGGEPE